jgi:mono/diheme cytochrome c family protein
MVSACDAHRAGENAFNQRCLGCHTLSEIEQRLAGRPAADCVRHLEPFLAQHHAPDPAEREAILAWLDARLCRQD